MSREGNDMLVRFVVAEMIFYVPEVPPEPTAEPESKRVK